MISFLSKNNDGQKAAYYCRQTVFATVRSEFWSLEILYDEDEREIKVSNMSLGHVETLKIDFNFLEGGWVVIYAGMYVK